MTTIFYDPLTQKKIIDKTDKKTLNKIIKDNRLSTITEKVKLKKGFGYEIVNNKLKIFNMAERKKQNKVNNLLYKCDKCLKKVEKSEFNEYYDACYTCVDLSGRIGT